MMDSKSFSSAFVQTFESPPVGSASSLGFGGIPPIANQNHGTGRSASSPSFTENVQSVARGTSKTLFKPMVSLVFVISAETRFL